MSQILLTGATGLIGAEVYRKFSESFEVVRLGRRPECEIQADLSQPETFESLDFDGCETIIHCAGVTDEELKYEPTKGVIKSTLGMNALIQAGIKSNVKNFFYISTSHVYGEQVGLIKEKSNVNPLSDYSIAHYSSEQILRRNAQKIGNCRVLRPNAVFGVPALMDNFSRWSLIPFSFPLEAVYNKKIVLQSSGEQYRNFVGIEDIANCIENLFSTPSKETFEIVNPVGKETISVYQFAQKTAEIYRRLTGEICLIERPLPTSELKEDFVYQTEFNFKNEKSDLSEYLTKFLTQILKDYTNGKKYIA